MSAEPDPLEELRVRIAAAQAAAERLAEETRAVREEAEDGVPRAAGVAGAELHALAAVAHAVRALLPEDLWAQLCDLIRGLLVLVRALLDRWIEALRDAPPAAPVARDIPVL
jgi:hypothetical protein